MFFSLKKCDRVKINIGELQVVAYNMDNLYVTFLLKVKYHNKDRIHGDGGDCLLGLPHFLSCSLSSDL